MTTIVYTGKFFLQDHEYMVCKYDYKGRYLGQYQDNMIDNDPPMFFFGKHEDCTNPDLTQEEMDNATNISFVLQIEREFS